MLDGGSCCRPRCQVSNVQILEFAGLEFVDPAMNLDVLLIRPGVLNDASVNDIFDLLLHRLGDLTGWEE